MLRECVLYQVANSVAYHRGKLFLRPYRKPVGLQGVVDGFAQIFNRIEQSAVKVKQYKLFHIVHLQRF